MAVLVEFAMFPTDKGGSVSEYVSKIIQMFKDSDVAYQLTPMGTIFETESMKAALDVIQKAYDVLEPHTERIYSTVKFDVKKNKNGIMKQKIQSIQNKIGEDINT
ncbi:MAG: MTH1187 family thiamine-binding protein [Bacteroidales bacterium]|nr:MTH1187 family thiamine-binding protein [Bacteroidales bacterium]MCF8327347.1 MTH1187 family thiamine-binding protein [Bacteroidales bacterium]